MDFSKASLIQLNSAQSGSELDDFTSERYDQFVRHFPARAHDVLDIGCNTGRGGEIIKSRLQHVRIVGLECVPDRVERIPQGIYESVVPAFADETPFPSLSFDAVVAGEIIEHIPGNSVFPTLCEIFRILRLKGRVLLTTPNPHYLKNRLKDLSVVSDPSHVSQHTISSMHRKLEDAGFTRIRFYGSGRMTRHIGQYFPVRCVYGSYLAVATKW